MICFIFSNSLPCLFHPRNYSNMPLLDFVTSVQPADPKIVIVFAAMINKSEVENILTDDKHHEALKIFNPSQLLRMLEFIAQQSSKVDHVTMF
jgi:hypothetical protein